MVNPICSNCDRPLIPDHILFEEHQIRIENTRLKDELYRISALTNNFLGLELGIGRNAYGGGGPSSLGSSLPMERIGNSNDIQFERSMLIDLALAAMDELLKMAQEDSPIWIKGLNGERDILNQEEYANISSCIGAKPPGFAAEATRETDIILINSSSLMDH
ncbi:homeobox-leucine zipper protein ANTHOCYANINLESS 2-like [Vicia villosa]|uniref:homeobox-leucine zipper protein ANTHOCYANINLESS 2-like n=1 Tax=Vicia villosa TaxID=3911 RepID=UPI00273B2633|nr:homeobox-leucine zipper protein ANTHOCYANINLESS 2-like [Vicia villosa]